tara:strand:- start:13085 stop:13636 length:552 start_codon:yes stop_codon:yes gene_type:complete
MNSYFIGLQEKLPIEVCDEIVNTIKQEQKEDAQTIGGKDDDYRKTKVVGIPFGSEKHKLYDDVLKPYVLSANRQCFGFSLNGVSEFQIAEYGTGHFYKEHMDCFLKNIASQRKLSITVQLSEAKEYEGGDFLFTKDISTPCQDLMKEKGRIIVFPSFIYHQVQKITSGTRYSLVGWYEGNHWK